MLLYRLNYFNFFQSCTTIITALKQGMSKKKYLDYDRKIEQHLPVIGLK